MLAGIDRERAAFFSFLTIVVLLLWIPEYPPMVDMPQHAGQVSQLERLLSSESRWADQVQVNMLTPYWIGYGVWFFLALLFPLKIASKLLLSLCFLAFVFSFSVLRRKFGSPKILDWILVPVFFGYAYEWGMITFLLALPVGVAFFLANMNWLSSGRGTGGVWVLLIGVVLFFSHGLVFSFFIVCSSLYIFVSSRFSILGALRFAWPYLILSVLPIVYVIRPDPLAGYYSYGAAGAIWGGWLDRAQGLLYMPWGIAPRGPSTYLLSLLIIVFPFIMGMRPTRDRSRYVLFACAAVAFFALPHYVSNTFLLYQRFSILLLPAYILCFDADGIKTHAERSPNWAWPRYLWCCLAVLMMHGPAANLILFNREVLAFSTLLRALPEGKRALSWIYDRESRVVDVPSVYLHFPVWYQVERDGWVDYNFSWFHPQIVRFSPEALPEVKPGLEWMRDLPFHLEDCSRYDLIFLHSYLVPSNDILQGTNCPHVPYLQAGSWYVYALPDVNKGDLE